MFSYEFGEISKKNSGRLLLKRKNFENEYVGCPQIARIVIDFEQNSALKERSKSKYCCY